VRTNKNKSHSQSHKTNKGNPVPQKSFSSLFERVPPLWIWAPLMLIVLAFVSVPGIYADTFGLGLQRGVLIVLTIRAALVWLAAIGVLLFTASVLIRKRKELLKQYPMFLVLMCWIGVLALPSVMLAGFQTPQTSYDLARYYTEGVIEERTAPVANFQEECSRNTRTRLCKLWVELEDGSRYATTGALADAFKQHKDVQAVRVLPVSRRLIGIRTQDGWL